MRRRTLVVLAALGITGSASVLAGGWCVVTLSNVPASLTAGRPVTLPYTVRQHGHRPVNDLAGRIEARLGSTVIRSHAHKLPPDGTYAATLTFPAAGAWTVDVISGAALTGHTLSLVVDVVAPGTRRPDVSAVDHGRRLFNGKGCVMCHTHAEFSGRQSFGGIDLSKKKYTAEVVTAFLRSVEARAELADPFEKMPNLGLAEHEIATLAAFLGRQD